MANNYCRDKRNSDGTDYYSTHCFKDCFARHMLTSCGCVDFTANSKFCVVSLLSTLEYECHCYILLFFYIIETFIGT